jgi:hypothetical protein
MGFSLLGWSAELLDASSSDVSAMLAGLVLAAQGTLGSVADAAAITTHCNMKNAFTPPVAASMFRATKSSKGRTA